MRILRLIPAQPGLTISGTRAYRAAPSRPRNAPSKGESTSWGPQPVLFWALVSQQDGITSLPVTSHSLAYASGREGSLLRTLNDWARVGWHEDSDGSGWRYNWWEVA